MPAIDDVFAEIRAVRSWQDRVARAEAGAAVFSPRAAYQMRLAAQMWPDMSPGALLAVGHGGYPATHPVVRQLGELSSKLQLRNHPFGTGWGEHSVTPGMRRAANEQRLRRNQLGQARQYLGSIQRARPTWLEGAPPEAMDAWRTLEQSGHVDERTGFVVEPAHGRNVVSEDPGIFAYQDALAKLTGLGLKVPVLSRQSPNKDPEVPVLATSRVPDDRSPLRFAYEQVLERGTPEWEAVFGAPEGPSLFEQAKRELGGGPTPAGGPEAQAMGVTNRALTEATQGAFMGMDWGVQEFQGQVRNLYAATHGRQVDWWEAQSDLGIALTTGKDPGSGFFVGHESQVAQERREREAERGMIGGHRVTLGRWVADGLLPFDIESRPAMILSGTVDAAVQLFADPTALLAGKVGAIQQSRRVFAQPDEAAGVVRGLRAIVRPQSARQWLDSERGIRALEGFAAERSPYTIWRGSNRKMPLSVANRLADTRTVDEARAVLEPELGRSIRHIATVDRRLPVGDIRVMPARGKIDAHNQDIVAFQVEATLRNAKAPDSAIREAVDRVARAGNSPIKLNAAIRRAIDDDLDGILALGGVDETLRSRVTNLYFGAHEEQSNTFVEAIAHDGPTDNPLMVEGVRQSYPGAHLIVEHAPEYLSLPDPRAVRALTSRFPNVFGRNVFVKADLKPRLPTAALEFVVNSMWKPLQLMRLAWTVRVIAEEQIRMAAAGYDSVFKHPASYIAWRTGTKGNVDLLGTALDTAREFKASLARTHGGWVDRAMPQSGIKHPFVRDNLPERDAYNQARAAQLITLASDPVAQRVARAESLDDVYEWFLRGPGNKFRGEIAAAHPGRYDTEDLARAYIDTVQQRIDYMTGGKPELLDAVRTGKFDGEEMLTGTLMHRKLPGWVGQFADDTAPLEVIGDVATSRSIGNRWDSMVDAMFGFLMTNRTNNLSRSPTFKQEYWRETERLIGFASEDTKRAVIAAAREANLGSRAIRRMERARATGQASLDEIDLLAKGEALDRTKGLLYDMTRRGRFMDAARLVFPFGEAWNEVLQTWFHPTRGLASPLTGRGLRNVRRFQQTFQGALGEDFGELMGAPEGPNGSLGFFWRGEDGEEKFVYPGSSFLTEHLVGVPIPLVGRVQGLSMFGTVMPGLGPAVQIPVGWFLQNKPGPEWFKEFVGDLEMMEVGPLGTVREQLLPFGAPGMEDQGDLASILNFVPPWMRTTFDWISNGDGNEQAWANSVMAMAAYKRTTGQYGFTIEEQQRLMEDSAWAARKFHVIKSLGALALPASPAGEWQVLDKNDNLVRLRALAEEYRDLQKDDYATADQAFLERYGENVLLAVQPRTAGIEYAVPVTREGAQWVLENPGVRKSLPHTYGFFAPQGGEFDYSLYDAQFENNQRVQLSPETWIRLMSATKAALVLEDARSQLGEFDGTAEGDAHMAEVRDWLNENIEGWDDMSGIPERPSTGVLIRELYKAVDNKAVLGTEAGQGLAAYLKGRDEIVAYQESLGLRGRGGALSTSTRLDSGRRYLSELAAWVVDKYPGFKTVWDIVLSREVTTRE